MTYLLRLLLRLVKDELPVQRVLDPTPGKRFSILRIPSSRVPVASAGSDGISAYFSITKRSRSSRNSLTRFGEQKKKIAFSILDGRAEKNVL